LNKKGFFGDILFIAVILLFAGLAVMFLFFLLDTFEQTLSTTTLNDTDFGAKSLQGMGIISGKMDYVFTAFFVAMVLGILVVSWLVPLNFIFAGIYFIVLILAVVVSAILANVWEAVSVTGTLATVTASLPITNFVLLKLPFFVGVIGIMGMVAMFAKPQVLEGLQ